MYGYSGTNSQRVYNPCVKLVANQIGGATAFRGNLDYMGRFI